MPGVGVPYARVDFESEEGGFDTMLADANGDYVVQLPPGDYATSYIEQMRLQGTVKATQLYGALVDIGVEYDGMVHISQLADRFVKDPRQVVQVGDRIEVGGRVIDTGQPRVDPRGRLRTARPGLRRVSRKG